MMKIRRVSPWWAIAAAVLFFTGCRGNTPPTAFYTLSPMPGAQTKGPAPATVKGVSISIGPISFPDYLARPQIVTRSGSNRLAISEFNRWGGDLDQDFTRVMVENLSALLPGDHVLASSWDSRFDPTYRVAFDVLRFDGRLGKDVLLDVTWMINGQGDSANPLFIKRSVIRQRVSGKGYGALIAACNRALAELSRQVAGRITVLSENKSR